MRSLILKIIAVIAWFGLTLYIGLQAAYSPEGYDWTMSALTMGAGVWLFFCAAEFTRVDNKGLFLLGFSYTSPLIYIVARLMHLLQGRPISVCVYIASVICIVPYTFWFVVEEKRSGFLP